MMYTFYIWIVFNIVICVLAKLAADYYYIRYSSDKSISKVIFVIGYWQYSMAEKHMTEEKIGNFRIIYKSAQILWLLLFAQIVIMLMIAAITN